MALSQKHVVVSTIVVVVLLAYGLAGHAPHQASADAEMAGAVAALCLLLVTVLGSAAVPRPAPRPESHGEGRLSPLEPRLPLPVVDGRARASPDMLQRFRN